MWDSSKPGALYCVKGKKSVPLLLTGIAQLCAGSNTWSLMLDLNNSELVRVKVIYQFLSVYLVSLAVELLLIPIDSDLLANSKTLFLGPDLCATKEALWIAEDLYL